MAVPADDEREHGFSTQLEIPIIEVVDRSPYPEATREDLVGTMTSSSFLDGLEVEEAIRITIEKLEEEKMGHKKINYRLRDANFSRQRYWGEPFPIIYDKEGIPKTVPLDELPVVLPDTEDFRPARDGRSPLARLEEWVKYDDEHTRETDKIGRASWRERV